MAETEDLIEAIEGAATWDARVALVRKVPELFGVGRQQPIYRQIAQRLYVPHLKPDFAYVPWREEYELEPFERSYRRVVEATDTFARVSVDDIAELIGSAPETLKVLRTILGLTTQEFAATVTLLGATTDGTRSSAGRIKSIEAGAVPKASEARSFAQVIERVLAGDMFPSAATDVRPKTEKPDTKDGWESVRKLARNGVPYGVFLHQRHYGGAFRQLLDATSTQRGNILEEAVVALFDAHGVLYIRTGSANQAEINRRFGLSVTPAPDFVVHDASDTLKAMLECKGANDGGTARDKAARFRALRQEGIRLGGVPVLAVLAGLGWTRASDALGPVVQATDGRVFTLSNLDEMLTVQPFPGLVGS